MVHKLKEDQIVRTASLDLGEVFNELAIGETKIFKTLYQLNQLLSKSITFSKVRNGMFQQNQFFSEFTILGESRSKPLIQKLPEAVFRKQPSLHESCVF